MGFFRDCKAELMEGLRDNPIHATKEVRHGTGIGVKPLQEKTDEFSRRFLQAAVRGHMISRSIQKGYDPMRMMLNARMMQMSMPRPPAPAPHMDDMEMGS